MWWFNKKKVAMDDLISHKEEPRQELSSLINDPFRKSKITSIDAHYNMKIFTGQWYAWGYVEFQDGNTSGKQRFETSNMDDLMMEMHKFIKSLK